MAAIVYQTNKKTGITYAYESLSHWDKEKKTVLVQNADVSEKWIMKHRKSSRRENGHLLNLMSTVLKEDQSPYRMYPATFMVLPICLMPLGKSLGSLETYRNAFPIHISKFFLQHIS